MARRPPRPFDQAYLSYRRFALIDENSGCLLTPLKDSANPLITEELREWRGDAVPLEDEQIHDVTNDLYRQCINVEVEVEFERRRRPRRGHRRLRVVHHKPAERGVLPDELATIYNYRWETKLLFYELKTECELDEFDTNKKHVVEILLHTALLSLLVSRELLALLTERTADEIVFPPGWAATLRSHAQLLLCRLGDYLGYSPPLLLDRLVAEAQKVHQERQILQDELVTVMETTTEG